MHNCGTANNEDAKFCRTAETTWQGEPQKPQQAQQMPNQKYPVCNPRKNAKVENYLVFSILLHSLLSAFGIAAISSPARWIRNLP